MCTTAAAGLIFCWYNMTRCRAESSSGLYTLPCLLAPAAGLHTAIPLPHACDSQHLTPHANWCQSHNCLRFCVNMLFSAACFCSRHVAYYPMLSSAINSNKCCRTCVHSFEATFLCKRLVLACPPAWCTKNRSIMLHCEIWAWRMCQPGKHTSYNPKHKLLSSVKAGSTHLHSLLTTGSCHYPPVCNRHLQSLHLQGCPWQ